MTRRAGRWWSRSRWRHVPTVTGVLAGLATIGQIVAEVLGNGVLGNLGWVPVLALAIGSVILQRVESRRPAPEPAEDPPAPPNTPLPPSAALLGRDLVIDAAVRQLRAQGILLVHGPSGTGVSSVAVEVAHRVVPDPAAQEYVDLLGRNQPKPDSARRVAIKVLAALGLAQRLIRNEEAAGRRIRDQLRDSGRILVLDNVTHSGQISWLFDHVPGAYLIAAGSLDPAGLRGPAEAVTPLDHESALELMAGQDPEDHPGPSVRARIQADPQRARELAERYLGPARTAITVGEWLARNHRVTIRDLLDDLRDREPSTLASYIRGQLLAGASDDARTLLAALARVPVSVLSESAVAALIDEDVPRTAALLDELIRQRVVQRLRPARYLVLEEARALGAASGLPSADAAARMVRYYGQLAAAHSSALWSDSESDAASAARDWFRAEDTALAQLLGTDDPPRRAAADLWRIADALESWFTLENRPADRRDVAHAFADTARKLGDRAAQLTAHLRLIAICRLAGDLDEADRHLVAAQDLLDSRRGGAGFHTNRGLLHLTSGRVDQAHQELQRSAATRPRGDEVGRVTDLINLGVVLLRQDKLNAAHARLSEAVAVAERCGDLAGRAHAQELLGLVAHHHHDERSAWDLWAKARLLYERQGDGIGQARCLAHAAEMLLEQGRDQAEAEAMLGQSLELRGSQDAGVGAALAHLRLGQIAIRSGRADRADRARQHRTDGLAALRGWDGGRQEPVEVTAVRAQLDALPP